MWKIIYRSLAYIFLIPGILYLLINRKTRGSLLPRIFPKISHPFKNEILWIHAASLGEALIGKNLAEFLGRKKKFSFVFTTNTPYARDLIMRTFPHPVETYYTPIDVDLVLRSFIKNLNLRALILIETEIWPNMIWEVKRKGVPVIVVNGRISDRTFPLYKKFSFFMREVLSCLDFVLAQSETHLERFAQLGAEKAKIDVIPNIKYLANLTEKFHVIEKDRAITFGSIRYNEKNALIDVILELKGKFPDFTFFVAPRELSMVEELDKNLRDRFSVRRYSILKEEGWNLKGLDIVLVDTFGDLHEIYGRSLVAFVGGSLAPYGGHNIIEPLFFGTPVLFGPYVENFKDLSRDVLSSGCGIMVRNEKELITQIERLISDDHLRSKMALSGKKLIEEKREEIEKKLEILLKLMEKR